MNERWHWAAIWSEGKLKRGWAGSLDRALEKTEGCKLCSIAQEREVVAGQVPELRKSFKRNARGEEWRNG